MSPLTVVDPVAPGRKRVSSTSRWMSFPVALMMICFVAVLPPIARALLALDAAVHAHNDAIVTAILWIAPFAVIALAVAGLVAIYRGRRTTA
jgi:hypothetical protein